MLVGGLAIGKYLVPGTPLGGEHTPAEFARSPRSLAERGIERSELTSMDPTTAVAPTQAGAAYRLLQRLIAVRPEEVRAVLWCWLYIFAVLSSYYIMRPIRDQMGVAGGVNNLHWLFTGTLVGMLLVNLPFAYLVKNLPRSRFIPLTYRFFAANIVLFALALHLAGARADGLGRARLLHLGLGLQSLRRLGVLADQCRSVQPRARQAAVRLHRGRSDGRRDRGSRRSRRLARYVSPTLLLIGAAVLLEVAVFAARASAPVAGLHQPRR